MTESHYHQHLVKKRGGCTRNGKEAAAVEERGKNSEWDRDVTMSNTLFDKMLRISIR